MLSELKRLFLVNKPNVGGGDPLQINLPTIVKQSMLAEKKINDMLDQIVKEKGSSTPNIIWKIVDAPDVH